jgi:predicted AlkP superfamily pyrophosphatase or phosphodiesterase
MTIARRRAAGWLALVAALGLAAGAGAGAGAKPLNPNAPKKPQAPAGAVKPKGGPAAPRMSRRVVLVSLDGAGAEELQRLWGDDQLDEGGFARFFREGEAASALVPVDPTLTAPNHVSLATGAAPDHTGIVGNRFHPAGAPPFAAVRGFDFPIGAETLWEAARRQKKQSVVLAWPGADGTGPRRRGDVGMTWVAEPDREPQVVVLKRSDWRPAAAPGATPKAGGGSPGLAAHVTLAGNGDAAPVGFDLFAVGGSAGGGAGGGAGSGSGPDRQGGQGALVVAASLAGAGGAGGRPPSAANLEVSEPLAPGHWAELAFPDRGGRSVCWIKVLALDPGLEAVKVYFGGTWRLPAYPADFASDLVESGLAWPGPPDDRRLAAGWRGEPDSIDLDTWTEQAERFAAFFGGVMRVAAAREDWDLMLGYMPVIDEAGHSLLLADPHQAGFSAARADQLARARRRVWQAVDRELRLLMAAVDLGRTTVVVVSDHGMAPVHTAIDLNALLGERGELAVAPASGTGAAAGSAAPRGSGPVAVPGSAAAARPESGRLAAYALGDGGMAHLYLLRPVRPEGAPPVDAERQKLLAELRDQLLAFRAGDDLPIERVLTRQQAAEVGLDHPNSGDLIVFARQGYVFDAGPAPAGAAVTHPAPVYGMHGYLAANPAMRGIYLAIGKDVKPAASSGPVQAIDVAGRVARWLGIQKPAPAAAAGSR